MALFEILNKSYKQITLTLAKPIPTLSFNENNYKLFWRYVHSQCQRTTHMNSGKVKQILKICRQYLDNCYMENQPLL